VNPVMSRTQIKRMIAESVTALYPTLFYIGTDESNIFNPVIVGYPLLPNSWANGSSSPITGVAEVSYQVVGPSLQWQRITRFKFIPEADPTTFPSGKAVELYGPAFPGRPLKVVTRSNFGLFVNESDTLESIGLRSEWRDLLRLDTCARLITSLDSARLQLTTIEASGRADGLVPVTAAQQVARQLKAQYADRLQQERRRLLIDYPSYQQRQL
jgi:hypothetical protein